MPILTTVSSAASTASSLFPNDSKFYGPVQEQVPDIIDVDAQARFRGTVAVTSIIFRSCIRTLTFRSFCFLKFLLLRHLVKFLAVRVAVVVAAVAAPAGVVVAAVVVVAATSTQTFEAKPLVANASRASAQAWKIETRGSKTQA